MKQKITTSFIAKEIAIGFLITLIATLFGCYLVVEFFSLEPFETTLQHIQTKSKYSQVLTLGALANFFVFFVFSKKKQWYRMRGVLLETFVVAFLVVYLFYRFG
ncbi:MAG: hypothetical protein KGV44_01005 [Flavobacteriaceae bacterium]|nr:hypothetical protein [Flavobacteriaceae bacterium]